MPESEAAPPRTGSRLPVAVLGGTGFHGSGLSRLLLDQEHRQAATRGIAGDAGSVDAAADDQQVVRRCIV